MPWPVATPPVENHASFMARITPFFAPSQVCMIDIGYMLAKHAHRAQVRKEIDANGDHVRYFEHVRRSTLIGLDLCQIIRFDTTIGLMFHDTVEDTHLTALHIDVLYGPDICRLVQAVSKVPPEGFVDRLLIWPDWRVFFCKGCDRLDNLRTLLDQPVEFRRKQVVETKDKYYRVFDRMVMLTPEEYRDGTRRLRDAIHEAAESIPIQ